MNFLPVINKSRALLTLIALPASMLLNGAVQADIYRSLDRNPPVYTNTPPAEGRWEVVIKETPAAVRAEPAPAPQRFAVNSQAPYADHIQAAATANNIDAALIRAVITAESGNNPYAVSRTGAVGLMQLMPETASRYNVTDSRDPGQNIHGGARYLRDLLQMFNQDVRLAVAAYNAGEQAVIKYGNHIPPYRETIAYVPKVLKFYERFRNGLPAAESSGYRHAASTRMISYKRAVSSAAGTVSYQRVASSGSASYRRAAAATKKHGARSGASVIYLARSPS